MYLVWSVIEPVPYFNQFSQPSIRWQSALCILTGNSSGTIPYGLGVYSV